jgi:hypothetical protein
MKIKTVGQMHIERFIRMDLAVSFAARAVKGMMVIMGDDARYWVVSMADGERLIRMGYEALPLGI